MPQAERMAERLRRVLPGGVDLGTQLGRAQLVRAGVWAALIVLALSAVAALFTAAHAVRLAARLADANVSGMAAGPTGWAESYVSTYVSAGEGTEDRLRPFLADPPQLEARPNGLRSVRTWVVDAQQVRAGYWSVTVAADLEGPKQRGRFAALGTRYFRVGVVAAGGGFAAADLPAVVSAPVRVPLPPPLYGGPPLDLGDPMVDAVAHFLDAYLVGRGELVRYVAAEAGLAPVVPVPFIRAEVVRVTAATSVGVAREAKAILAQVRAVDAGGRVQLLAYALRMATRGGQWVVAAMDAAPLLAQGDRVR
ncbi:conjugal transfer protein [Actinomadura barringtoniae]|uniref:Conjugal transfer protein n=1 Tax=Actinomadura barringtoniae TaxID=1427535 RepID=A0A939P9N9_9ACTN|nr:conjugal transfer protein [Actinomadura barringtoniae]MBO2448722.1 conjugal transfer protein [Actinomadura barringtoniae]